MMLDIETLGIMPDSVVLTVGAIKFNPYSLHEPYDPLYLRLDVDEQLSMDRHVCEDTVAWWGKQDEEVREEALGEGNRVNIESFTKQLNKYSTGVSEFWCKGTNFDFVILNNLYQQFKFHIPWKYYLFRDCRTVFNMAPYRIEKHADLHNALADSVAQAVDVQKIYKHLGIKNG